MFYVFEDVNFNVNYRDALKINTVIITLKVVKYLVQMCLVLL